MIRALFVKETRLAASVITYFFIAFAFMTLLPGYPILCGAFFITLGIFQSYQNYREANDIVFSALLPVAKKDVVKGKYIFVLFIEMSGFALMTLLTILRMTLLSTAAVYRENALMNANLFFLGTVLLIFGLFNLIFIGGFFKTAYKFARNFIPYIIVTFITIGIAEALHHFPGMGDLNAFGLEHIELQIISLLTGGLMFVLLTLVSYRKACADFDKLDL